MARGDPRGAFLRLWREIDHLDPDHLERSAKEEKLGELRRVELEQPSDKYV